MFRNTTLAFRLATVSLFAVLVAVVPASAQGPDAVADPSLSNASVEQHLFNTCTDLGAAGFDTSYGRGIINASAAVAAAGH